jgi:hypothetical protein
MSLDALLNKVATQGKDQSVATSGGGDYTPPEAGQTGARIVAYYEVGQHEGEYKGEKKINNEVIIIFELIGKKHPPKELEDGTKVPVRLSLLMNLSTNEKAGYFKMFSRLRTEERHFVQLLGSAVLLNVVHRDAGEGDKKRVYANIDKESVRKPIIQVPDMEDGAVVGVKDQPFPVGAALTPLKAFVWEFADAEMWDSIFIEGEYPERKDEKTRKVIAAAKSKNSIQLKIASALNFKGLPCYDYAASKLVGGTVTREGVDALDEVVGDVTPSGPRDADDPLDGIA